MNTINYSELLETFVRKHHLVVEELTEKQLAEAIRQAIPDFRRYIVHSQNQQVVYLPGQEADRLRVLYEELLDAVERKHEGESRHETALRYIREAEDQSKEEEKSES